MAADKAPKDASGQAANYIARLRDIPDCKPYQERIEQAGKGPVAPQTHRALSRAFMDAKAQGCVKPVNSREPEKKPFPASGTVRYLRQVAAREFTSKLTLTIEAGNLGRLYVARLMDKRTRLPLMDVYLTSGSSQAMGLPPGEYELTVLKGNTWYNEVRQFGPGGAAAVTGNISAVKDGDVEVIITK